MSVLIYAALEYIDFIDAKKKALQNEFYKSQAISMQERVTSLILAKQKSTVAMALSLANDDRLRKDMAKNEISSQYYKRLIDNFRTHTQYKNIWVHVVDKNLNSLYRSWTDITGDSLADIRDDLVHVKDTKKITYSVSAGKFTLSIKAMVPILQDGNIVGILEVISHFNSIAKQLKEFDTDSVVVLQKEYSKQLQYPFTKLFIDDYYIANFDAPLQLMERMRKKGVDSFFNLSYFVDENYMVIAYPIHSFSKKILGYYIMFKRTEDISKVDLDFFMFKWLAMGLLVLMGLAGFINIFLFYHRNKQRIYYKNIINSSTNIMLITDRENILDVNDPFFKYFDKYKNLKEFKKDYSCICDIFVDENGYIQKDMDGLNWINYMIKHENLHHKAKIEYKENIYYFSLSASLISKEKNLYNVVFSDITKQENYKLDLELLSTTDALTGVGNRRFFHTKMDEEMSRSNRYDNNLSFIMIDIDYFKKVNDIHGHGVGDTVLIEYSKLISSMLRDSDVLCRIGGEEFMIILPQTGKEAASVIAEKLRIEVMEYKKVLPITISSGVTEYIHGEDEEHVLKRVDEALYEAKDNGRNKVVIK